MSVRLELIASLHYDPASGIFCWASTNSNRAQVGRIAGHKCRHHGYVMIRLNGRLHRAHRLAWLWMTGHEAPAGIDHINGAKDDNRWSNLRAANQSQNAANSTISRNNTSGHKGVVWHKRADKWMAQITKDGKVQYLGLFNNIDDAAAAYKQAAIGMYGEFARVE